jgi:ATP-dependent DNA helicase RecG
VRGEGTLLGARQKGQTDLRLASLTDPGDMALLAEARRLAEELAEEDPDLSRHPEVADELRVLLSEDEGEYLFKS